jgi:hypothetical protein
VQCLLFLVKEKEYETSYIKIKSVNHLAYNVSKRSFDRLEQSAEKAEMAEKAEEPVLEHMIANNKPTNAKSLADLLQSKGIKKVRARVIKASHARGRQIVEMQ